MEDISNILEANIDYEGQKLVKNISQTLVIVGAALGLIVGFLAQDLKYTLYIFAGACLLTFLITLPPYPQYRRHSLKWLPVESTKPSGISIEI